MKISTNEDIGCIVINENLDIISVNHESINYELLPVETLSSGEVY